MSACEIDRHPKPCHGVQTFPPECFVCGIIDSPDLDAAVERYADLDPHWWCGFRNGPR